MKNLILTLLLIFPIGIFAQNVGINEDGSSPNAGAILDIKSADKGILIPRLESTAVANPVEGMLIFQPSDKQFYYFKNNTWTALGGTVSGGEFTATGDLVYNAGNLDAQDFLFGRSVRPGFTDISDKFLYYEQNTGAFRGGEVVNSQVWNQINMGKNSFAYGKNVEVDGDNSHSLGVQNIVDGSSAFAFGVRDTVTGFIGSGAIGEENSNAGAYGTIVIGKQNQIFAGAEEGSIALGKGNKLGPDSDHGSIAIGMDNSNASGYGSVVMGYKNAALTDSGAITIGKGLINNYDHAVIMGRYNAYSNYSIDPVFAVGNGNSPYDFNNPRHDAFSLLENGYAGINYNYPTNTLAVSNPGETPREGITILGEENLNTHVNLILNNRGFGGRSWSLVSSGNGSIIGNGKFAIRDIDNQREALVIDSFLNVGIRTSTPNDDLNIKMSSENIYGGITVDAAENTLESHLILNATPSNGARFVIASTGENAILGKEKLVIRKGNNASDHLMVIGQTGNVGIGISNPGFKLTVGTEVNDAGGILVRGGTSTNRPMLQLENNGFQGRTYSVFSSGQAAGVGTGKYVVRDETRGWNVFIIDSTGNTGIGLIAPKERLDVDGAIVIGEANNVNEGTIQYKNNEFRGYDGTEWVEFGGGGSGSGLSLSDTDSDTRIELELLADDDIIRFSLDNFNRFMMEKNPGEIARLRFVNTSDNIVIGSGEAIESQDNRNIIIGNDAGINHTDASNDNVFIGDGAGKDGKGESLIAIGTNALSNSEISGLREGTIAIGYDALTAVTPTSGGIFPALAIGYEAGKDATATGIYIGYKAGQSATGGNNTILGNNTGINITSGFSNVIIGSQVGASLTTGHNNIFIGPGSGFQISAGDDNTHLGVNANANANRTNTTVLGYNATATASNQIRIGNSSVSSIGGFSGWSNISDERFKTSIKEDIPGLSFIQKLRPVSYQLDIDAFEDKYDLEKPTTKERIAAKKAKEQIRQTGFIAQEVEQASKDLGFEFSGVDAPKNEDDHYGLRYAEFVVPLVKAVQEQQEEIETMKTEHTKELQELKKMIKELKEQIEK